ncbi:MAG TPA: ATP-binding protein [Verrucomicrobiae bacterium]|nr:ATP-binding protein [Verrucomicrobiae bacterium]
MAIFGTNAAAARRRFSSVWQGLSQRQGRFFAGLLFLSILSAGIRVGAQGQTNLPVPAASQTLRVNGVVLCADAGWHQFYVFDGRDTVYFNADDFDSLPAEGRKVEITGDLRGGRQENLHLTVLGTATLPPAAPLDIAELARYHGHWVQTTGRVMSVETSRGRLALLLHGEAGKNAVVYLLGSPPPNDFQKFLGCEIQVRGINASTVIDGQLDSALLFLPGLDELTILEPAGSRPPVPVISISGLQNRELGSWTNGWVHITGSIVAYQSGQSLVVKDPTGVMRAKIIQLTEISQDERVDVWGFLEVSPTGTFLNNAYFEAARPAVEATSPALARPATPPSLENTNGLMPLPAIITSMSEVHKMRREQAAQNISVRVRGVLTYADPAWRNGFIQDKSDALYVDLDPSQKELQPGQWVELTGQTGPGGFAPEVIHSRIQVLGLTNLPAPARVVMQDLASGHWDARWIALEGVVRRVDGGTDHLTLSVMTPDGRFRAIIPVAPGQPIPSLIDALVSVQGACTSELNARRQLSGITLHTPGFDQVQIIEPPPTDPFAITNTKIGSVATFDPDRLAIRRIKVQGVVTLQLPDQGFYLQDESGGIFVQTLQTNVMRIGDSLEVLGFPAIGNFSPVLEEASFRQTANLTAPVPKWTTAEQILLHGTNDGQIVQLEARLLQSVPRSAHPQLVLQAGSIIFNASFEALAGRLQAPALVSGSLLRLKGICSIQGDQRHEPVTFSLMISRPEDIEVRETPPWWTARHAFTVAGSLAVAVAVSLAWVGLLRRQVRGQTKVIWQQLKEAEVLEQEILEISNREQRRIGHDLHDGVCQQLAGIALMTATLADELETKNSAAAAGAERISTLLNEAIEQTRGVARGLFPVRLEENGLVSALEELAANASELFKINCRFVSNHPPAAVEKGIALHLYYIVLEAVANASKHGSAKNVVISLEPAGERYQISVQDDGVGFSQPAGAHKGMGIRIMQYRSRVIGATLHLQSPPGSGTCVTCGFLPAPTEALPADGNSGKRRAGAPAEKFGT